MQPGIIGLSQSGKTTIFNALTKAEAPLIVAALSAICMFGCYPAGFKQVDQRNVRDQFHVPKNVPFVAFDSDPKEAGWFGREGLRIEGALQFDEAQLKEYLARLDDPGVWKPVRFLQYSPDRAQSHTDSAFSWLPLPMHPWAEGYLKHWEHLPEVLAIRNGKYHCAVMMGEMAGTAANKQGGQYPKWTWRMKHCSEIDSTEHPVITTFGALDLDGRKLYVYIGFSG
jgi:hypothetical protein